MRGSATALKDRSRGGRFPDTRRQHRRDALPRDRQQWRLGLRHHRLRIPRANGLSLISLSIRCSRSNADPCHPCHAGPSLRGWWLLERTPSIRAVALCSARQPILCHGLLPQTVALWCARRRTRPHGNIVVLLAGPAGEAYGSAGFGPTCERRCAQSRSRRRPGPSAACPISSRDSLRGRAPLRLRHAGP